MSVGRQPSIRRRPSSRTVICHCSRPFGVGAAGGDDGAALNVLRRQRGMAGGHLRHAGHPVDELRPVLRHLLLQRCIIHIKPASSARW